MTKDASELLQDLATGKLSCLVVTTAFCKAAAIAHQVNKSSFHLLILANLCINKVTNCLTEIFFTQALERAKELDVSFAKSGKATGALFGMPISLKDQFQIKGTGNYASPDHESLLSDECDRMQYGNCLLDWPD